jgi:aldehyde:ferredoxin oxidoreductase
MGMDTISTGVVLGWVMEAGEKGLFKSDLKFGNPNGIKEVIYDIALQRGIGKDLGKGTRALSEKYGGKEFAVQVKGLEFAAYDPRAVFGMGLNYAVANRGACHMSSSIMVQESKLHMLNAHGTRGKALHVWFLENLSCLINSMHTCQMTSYAYQLEVPFVKYSSKLMQKFFMRYLPEIALRTVDVSMWPKLWSSITGIKLNQADFLKAGERIHILERYMNTREGISRKDDVLPERFLKEGRLTDPEKRTVPLEKMLDRYYKIRGYDLNGIPTDKILGKLGIKRNMKD